MKELEDETESYPRWLSQIIPDHNFYESRTDDERIYHVIALEMRREYLTWLISVTPSEHHDDIHRWIMMHDYVARKLFPEHQRHTQRSLEALG